MTWVRVAFTGLICLNIGAGDVRASVSVAAVWLVVESARASLPRRRPENRSQAYPRPYDRERRP